MPNIKDQTTVQAIAREYCSNGRNKLEALKTIGYKPSYYNTLGIGKVYSNIRVIEAIKAIDEDGAAKNEMTVERVQQMYIGAHDLAVEHNQPSAAVSAITGIARLYGMDKDASLDKQEPDVLTDKELESFRQLSIKMTKPTKTA
jgi:DNA helicase IV